MNHANYAHTFDLVMTTALISAARFLYGTFSALYGAVVEAIIYYMFVGIAAVVMATIKHPSFNIGDGSRVLLTLFRTLTAGIMAYLVYEFLAYPQIWGGNWLAYGVELGIVMLGIVIYLVFCYINLRRYGIDISVSYTEIPPE